MRILVAGASGAIGRLLVPALVADGHEVFGLSRSDAGCRAVTGMGATAVPGDILDGAAMSAVLDRTRPAVVINQVTDLTHRDLAGNARVRIVTQSTA